jgi:molybdopterin-containing oxidoreductase family iron-sulfur binding subunit
MPKPKSISLPVARITASPDARGPAARQCDPARPHPDEFARSSSAAPDEFSRRNFLMYGSAALTLAGLTGCSDRPREAIVPYVDPPEQVTPGEPQFFATTLTRSGYGRGVIVTTREGRPIKIEGNPDHPASLGAADAQMQAAVLDLYDPLRSNAVTHAGRPSTWGAFQAALQKQLATHQNDQGDGFYILTDPFSSPTAGSLLLDLQKQFPKLTVLSFDPLDPGTAFLSDQSGIEPDGWTMRYRWFGRVYDFAAADVVVNFASDFLTEEPGSLAYARQLIDRRRVTGDRPKMNRLYTTESDFSITGMASDHRLPARPVRVMQLARAVAAQLGVPGVEQRTDLTPAEARWVAAVSTDLSQAKGRSIVIAGPGLPLHAHEVASKINSFLGNFGKTIRMIDNPLSSKPPMFSRAGLNVSSLELLYEELAKSRVRTLLMLSENPVRCAPGDQRIGENVARLSQKPDAFVAHLGRYANETAFVSRWHVPMQHELEQWGDARAYDGTASIIQPMIAPQNSSRSVIDLLNAVLGRSNTSTYESVRAYWRKNRTAAASTDFETW